MIRILLVPSSDYLGHPFPQRHNQIFERLHDGENFEVHVARFKLFSKPKLKTKLVIHELSGDPAGSVSTYYLKGMFNHALEIRQIIRQENIDLVVFSNLSVPFAYTLIDYLSGMNIPIIFDLPDFYPTSAAGYLCDLKSVKGSLLVGSFDFMLRRILRRSNVVTAPSYSLMEYAKKVGARNVKCIPNGVSNGFSKLHDGAVIRKQLGFSDDDLVVGYIGSVEFWLDLKSAIKGFSLAKKNCHPMKLLLVGKGLFTDYSKNVLDWIKQEDLEKDTVWLDFIPYAEVPKYISAIDVGLIPFNVFNPTAFYAAPNKMWEYLSQRKPVISSPIPETLANLDSVLLAITAEDYAKVFSQVRRQISAVQETVDVGYGKALKNTWDYSVGLFANLVSSFIKKELIVN